MNHMIIKINLIMSITLMVKSLLLTEIHPEVYIALTCLYVHESIVMTHSCLSVTSTSKLCR
jgi:hypothetical protein